MVAFTVILATLTGAAQIALIVVLVRKFLRTREAGYVWLGVAVVIWPLLSHLLDLASRAFYNHLAQRGFSSLGLTFGDLVMLAAYTHQLIGACVVLVAVLHVCRIKGGSIQTA